MSDYFDDQRNAHIYLTHCLFLSLCTKTADSSVGAALSVSVSFIEWLLATNCFCVAPFVVVVFRLFSSYSSITVHIFCQCICTYVRSCRCCCGRLASKIDVIFQDERYLSCVQMSFFFRYFSLFSFLFRCTFGVVFFILFVRRVA